MSHRKFWDQFWEHRCVTLVDTEPEEEEDAATEPPAGAGEMTEEDYNEYSAMLDGVAEAAEAALRDIRERKQRLRQRLWLVQERIRRHKDRRSTTRGKRTPTMDKRTHARDRRTPTRDVDRVSSGSVEPDHIRVMYFKEEEAKQDKKGQDRRSREASWDRIRGTSDDRHREGSSGNRPYREGSRRTTPYGSRDSRQGGNHSHHHIVHCTGADGDSSEEEEEDNDYDVEETVSFEDMLEQAKAQSDRYSDVEAEDSEDDNFEPYVIHPYYAEYEARHIAVTTTEIGQPQEGKVCAEADGDDETADRADSVKSPGGNGPNYASSPRGGSGMSVASQAGEVRAVTSNDHTESVYEGEDQEVLEDLDREEEEEALQDEVKDEVDTREAVAGGSTDAETGVDSQLVRINNEDGTVAQPVHGKAPKGDGDPGAGSGPAVRWSWNGIPLERITSIAKPLKIFTVSHRPKIASGNARWSHTNDRPLLFLEQSLVPNPAHSGLGGGEADGEAIPPEGEEVLQVEMEDEDDQTY